jgi:hypothetical protein
MKSVPELKLACLTYGDVHLKDRVELVEQTRPIVVTNNLTGTPASLVAVSPSRSGTTWFQSIDRRLGNER